MPLAISVMRKYLPSLLKVPSSSSSHFLTGCWRNPFGGGPRGVAYPLLAITCATAAAAAGVAKRDVAAGRIEDVVLVVAAARARRRAAVVDSIVGFRLGFRGVWSEWPKEGVDDG